MTKPMDADQAKKLASLVATVRPTWAVSAITTALWQVRTQPLHRIAAAAIRAAMDPDIHTPAGIVWLDRPHWRPEPTRAEDVPTWHDPFADTTPADPDTIRAIRARKDQA